MSDRLKTVRTASVAYGSRMAKNRVQGESRSGDVVVNSAADESCWPVLNTRNRCECIAHTVQALSDADPEATVLSVDGIGGFDLISRAAMLTALRDAPGCDMAFPFVRQFLRSSLDKFLGG